jgi:hypothetical protein
MARTVVADRKSETQVAAPQQEDEGYEFEQNDA